MRYLTHKEGCQVYFPKKTIQSANNHIHQQTRTKKPSENKRGSYQKLSEEKKAEVGRYAAENGVGAAV